MKSIVLSIVILVCAIVGTCFAQPKTDFPIFENFKELIETSCETSTTFGFIKSWYGSYEITQIGCDENELPHGKIKIRNVAIDYEEFIFTTNHGKIEKVIRKFPTGSVQSVINYVNGFPNNAIEYYSNGELKVKCNAYNFDTDEFELCQGTRN